MCCFRKRCEVLKAKDQFDPCLVAFSGSTSWFHQGVLYAHRESHQRKDPALLLHTARVRGQKSRVFDLEIYPQMIGTDHGKNHWKRSSPAQLWLILGLEGWEWRQRVQDQVLQRPRCSFLVCRMLWHWNPQNKDIAIVIEKIQTRLLWDTALLIRY